MFGWQWQADLGTVGMNVAAALYIAPADRPRTMLVRMGAAHPAILLAAGTRLRVYPQR